MEPSKLIYPVFLEAEKDGFQQTVYGFFDADAGEKTLCIVLTLGGKAYRAPDACTAALCAKKPDNTLLRHSCTVRDGKIYYTPGAQLLSPGGKVECQAILFGADNAVICAPKFYLQTDEALWDGEIPDEPAASELLNWDVLGALSSPDGQQLLFHGAAVRTSACALAQTYALLPEGTEGMLGFVQNDTNGHPGGLYRFDTQWTYLPVGAQQASEPSVTLADTLPQTATQGDVVCLRGGEFYVYDQGQWHALFADLPPVVRIENADDLSLCAPLREGQLVYFTAGTQRTRGLYIYHNNALHYVQDGNAHTHANRTALDNITGDVLPLVGTLPATASEGDAVFLRGQGLFRRTGGAWESCEAPTVHIEETYAALQPMVEGRLYYVLTNMDRRKGFYALQDGSLYYLSSEDHTHANQSVLDKWSYAGGLKYDGMAVATTPVDDVQLLEQTTYDRLYLCTESLTPVLEEIPTELTDDIFVYAIVSGSDYIQISESNNSVTGLPERMLSVRLNGSTYTYLSVHEGDASSGWQDANGDPCSAPEITNFTVDGLSLYDETAHAYVVCDDFDDLDAHARAALKLLSMIVHTSADRVDNPYFPEDTVFRFGGTIEPNRKYAFRATYDFTLSLPTVPWQAEDAQFVLYLTCLHNIDVTFPAGTLFIGGVPDTTQGIHKIIGTWNRNEGCWMIGSVTAEAAT